MPDKEIEIGSSSSIVFRITEDKILLRTALYNYDTTHFYLSLSQAEAVLADLQEAVEQLREISKK